MKLKIYGSRGSAGFSSKTHSEYGGNSVCTALDIDGHIIVLDCGTGLMQFYEDRKNRFKSGFKFDILLSHLHIDHIIGFSAFEPILSPDSDIRIFTKSRNDKPLVSQVFGIFQPPYWPINIAGITRAEMIEIVGEDPIILGDGVIATPFFIKHHNDTVVFRIDADKSIVYLLDYEVNENLDKHDRLIDLCKNTDLVIFDATFLPHDYLSRRGWGHSTIEDGIALAEASGCKQMIFSHICQNYPDKVLNTVRDKLDESRFSIAFDGLEIEL